MGILQILSSKCGEIRQRCSNEDDCLMEAIRFWMKRCPFASYRWIVYQLNSNGLGAISQEMHHLLEPIQGKMNGRELPFNSTNIQQSLLAISFCFIHAASSTNRNHYAYRNNKYCANEKVNLYNKIPPEHNPTGQL